MGGRGAKAKAEGARSIANLLDAGPRKFRGKNFASASRMHIRGGRHVSGEGEEKSSKFPSKILSLQAYKSSFVDKRSKTRTHRVSVVRSSPPHFPSLPSFLSIPFLYLSRGYLSRHHAIYDTRIALHSGSRNSRARCNYENRISSYGD